MTSQEPSQDWKAFRDNFGQNLKAVRQAKGVSLEALSAKTGYSIMTLLRWEEKQQGIALYHLFRLGRALGIPPSFLIK